MARTYRALNVIDYVSTKSGKYEHLEPGDEFDDMSTLSVRHELEAGNIEDAADNPAADQKEMK